MLDSDLGASARWGGESLMLNVVFRQDYGAVRKVRLCPVGDRRLQPSHRRSLRDPSETFASGRFAALQLLQQSPVMRLKIWPTSCRMALSMS
jgi:hypothetical protein